MQKSQLLGKYLAESNHSPKTTFYGINNNLRDYLVKSNHSKVLQTALYQQNYVGFWFQKGSFDPEVRHCLVKLVMKY